MYLKSLYDHYSLLTKRVLAISQRQTFINSFIHKMAGKVSLHQNCVTVTLCVALSVCHKLEFYQNSCTNRGGFWAWEFAAFVDALCHQFIFRVLYSLNVSSVLWHCWLSGRKGIRRVKNWVVGCWHGYLPGARCRLAYGPADVTATHCLLLLYNPDWFYLSGTGPSR